MEVSATDRTGVRKMFPGRYHGDGGRKRRGHSVHRGSTFFPGVRQPIAVGTIPLPYLNGKDIRFNARQQADSATDKWGTGRDEKREDVTSKQPSQQKCGEGGGD